MTQPDLRLIVPAIAAWLGAWLALSLPLVTSSAFCAVAVVSGCAAWSRGRRSYTAMSLGFATAVAIAALRVWSLGVGPVDDLAVVNAVVSFDLVVTADPIRPNAATADGQQRGRELLVIRARAEELTARGQRMRIRSPVLVLATDPGWADVLPGERVTASGRLSERRRGQPIAAVLSANGPPLRHGQAPEVQRIAGQLRTGLRAAVRGLPPEERGLIPGLVVGDTSGMPRSLTEDFRTSGMTHLTAVSGANLAIVCGFVVYLGRWMGLRGRVLPALGALALLGFVVLARPQPSVLRAAVMGLVGLAALGSGRRGGGLAALGTAMLGLLLIDPWLARSYGFALSVLATMGLLVLAPGWATTLQARGLPLPLAHALAVPAAAQICCAPVIVLLSGQISLVAVPANLLAAPAVPFATVLGVLATLASGINASAASGLAQIAAAPTWWVITVAERAAALPLAETSWSGSVLGSLALVALLAGGMVLGRRAASRPRFLALVLAFLLLIAGAAATRPGWPPDDWLMVACDVGQGDALVLSAGAAGAVVVDAGPDPRLIDRCLRDLGVSTIAAVLLTHLHADHIDGLPGVLQGRTVGEVQLSVLHDQGSAEGARVHRWAAGSRVPVRDVAVGESFRLGALSWEVLWPTRRILGEGSAENNASLVLLAQRDGVRILLTGDVEPAAQRAMLARGRIGPVDVLKVAHHGSAAQAPELLATTRPRVALVSAGRQNDYGHPAPSTLLALLRSHAVVGRTDLDGSLAVAGGVQTLRLVMRDG